MLSRRRWLRLMAMAPLIGAVRPPVAAGTENPLQRRLYVAVPGIRNYLEHGGHGLLVYDIDQGHKLLKRIPTKGLNAKGVPLNVKGICASAATGRLYISTIQHLQCIDLKTETMLWERTHEAGCDRMSIAPDGSVLYVPSFEGSTWNVVSGDTGDVIAVLEPKSAAHNTVFGADGREVYLAGLKSPLLSVASTDGHRVVRTVGPFAASIRPFTVDGRQRRVFACVNDLLGFEVGDLKAGTKLCRVEVEGFQKGPVKRHGCPSHGIGLTPDEREVWVTDAFNQRLHRYDATTMPPRALGSIRLKDEPGWITFSIDGQFAYPSTGDVIDVKTGQIVAELKDELGRPVQSEKLLEVDFRDGEPARAGDQFGVGRVTELP